MFALSPVSLNHSKQCFFFLVTAAINVDRSVTSYNRKSPSHHTRPTKKKQELHTPNKPTYQWTNQQTRSHRNKFRPHNSDVIMTLPEHFNFFVEAQSWHFSLNVTSQNWSNAAQKSSFFVRNYYVDFGFAIQSIVATSYYSRSVKRCGQHVHLKRIRAIRKTANDSSAVCGIHSRSDLINEAEVGWSHARCVVRGNSTKKRYLSRCRKPLESGRYHTHVTCACVCGCVCTGKVSALFNESVGALVKMKRKLNERKKEWHF